MKPDSIQVHRFSKQGMRRQTIETIIALSSLFAIPMGMLAASSIRKNGFYSSETFDMLQFIAFYCAIFLGLYAFMWFFPRKTLDFQKDFITYPGGFGKAQERFMTLYPWPQLHRLIIYIGKEGQPRAIHLYTNRLLSFVLSDLENVGAVVDRIRALSKGELLVETRPCRFYHYTAGQLLFMPGWPNRRRVFGLVTLVGGIW